MRAVAFSIVILSISTLLLAMGCSSSGSAGDGGSGAGGESADGSGGSTEEGSGGQPPAGTGGADASSSCEEGCVLTLEADCESGPESQAECIADCEELRAGECGLEYQEFQACSAGQPVTCGDGGIPVVAACGDEQSTFIACLNAP